MSERWQFQSFVTCATLTTNTRPVVPTDNFRIVYAESAFVRFKLGQMVEIIVPRMKRIDQTVMIIRPLTKRLGQIMMISRLRTKRLVQIMMISRLRTKRLGQIMMISRLRTKRLGHSFHTCDFMWSL